MGVLQKPNGKGWGIILTGLHIYNRCLNHVSRSQVYQPHLIRAEDSSDEMSV